MSVFDRNVKTSLLLLYEKHILAVSGTKQSGRFLLNCITKKCIIAVKSGTFSFSFNCSTDM